MFDFQNLIEQETSLSLENGDYSYQCGTHYPRFIDGLPSHTSSAAVHGYLLIKGEDQIVITPGTPQEEIVQVLNFLNSTKNYVQES